MAGASVGLAARNRRAERDRVTALAETFHMLGEPNRLRIVLACLKAPVSVGVLADELGISPSLVSHHLRLLRAARLLAGRREGKRVFYAPADDHVRSVVRNMFDHVAEAV
jgi:DNA-binding transcriptional ArsR family regulator